MQKKKEIDLNQSSCFRHFDWEKVKTFYYVAKLGSFTNTANFLHLSQPALSKQIASLEKILGCPLFTRARRGLQLTRKGEELFNYVESMFLGIVEFTRKTHTELTTSKKRKVRIATTYSLAAYILDDILFDYNQNYPHLVFELITDNHLIDIFLKDVDIVIRPPDPRIGVGRKLKGLQKEFLFGLEKKLYASPEYLRKYGEPKTVDELKHHRLVSFADPDEHLYSDVNWILKLGMPEGELNEPIFTSTSTECLINAARRGLGITSSYAEMRIIKDSNLINILPDIKCEELKNYFIYPDYLEKDQEIMKLKDYLHKALPS